MHNLKAIYRQLAYRVEESELDMAVELSKTKRSIG